jgi:hypothetical protein
MPAQFSRGTRSALGSPSSGPSRHSPSRVIHARGCGGFRLIGLWSIAEDYAAVIRRVAHLTDFIVINVSSKNFSVWRFSYTVTLELPDRRHPHNLAVPSAWKRWKMVPLFAIRIFARQPVVRFSVRPTELGAYRIRRKAACESGFFF